MSKSPAKALQLKIDQKLFGLLIIAVNAAITYLVPLVGTIGNLTPMQSQSIQGFLGVFLNGLIVYLSLEQAQAPP